ncbi:MAG: hypothetical protein ACFFDX_06950 [Candidatus Odinarchaeota archaeon]
MIKLIKKKKTYFYLFTISSLIILSSIFFLLNSNRMIFYIENDNQIKSSSVIPGGGLWLDNPNFTDTVDPWFPTITGDNTDVDASYTPGQANFEVIGDQRTFSEISGTPLEEQWLNTTNPLFPALPDNYGIDQYGCWANHTWIDPDDPVQSPSINWERNITMPVDMSDYVITSASISAVYNASVTASPGGAGYQPNSFYGVDVPGDTVDSGSGYTRDYDSVRFYVLISDLENTEIHEIAWYQSIDLGKDSAGAYDSITDSFMDKVLEETLIIYLSSLFERDSSHFKITLGIRIKCVDNWDFDRDRWDPLRIKSCNLTFTYQKIIDQFTAISWNQIGNQISGDNVYITGANLNFKYKVNETWPNLLSPNSELRILLNNNSHSEAINLNLATTSFQEAKSEGFDITYLILKDINISLSIQLYLADEFLFNKSITISIDEVYLEISYITIFEETLSEPEIFRLLLILALIVGTALGTYLILYQKIFKYPLPVRKVRKYRRTLNKSEPPSTSITDSETSFDKLYKKELNKSSKFVKISYKEELGKASPTIEKITKNESIKTKGGGS